MSTWVEVNGGKLEKEFLEDNISDAKAYNWLEICACDLAEHVHCMICWIAILPELSPTSRLYRSKGGHACAYCFECFLTQGSPKQPET
jgi:hypothetical protein